MTAKRDSKSKSKANKRAKPDQRAVRDLEVRDGGDSVEGGKTRSEISMTFARNSRA